MNQPIETSTTTYYIHDGNELSEEEYNNELICAKIVSNNKVNLPSYYVLCNNLNQFFDPKNKDFSYRKPNNWKFKKVNLTTFNLYLNFLKYNYNSLLRQAERGM